MKKLALVIATTFVLAGCEPAATPEASKTPEPVYVTAPLTGIKYEQSTEQAKNLTKSSVACKIDNSEAARPQLNLNRTDIVFDEMVEGGLTRLVAIWQSDLPDAVGPVRSIRPMDPDILSAFGGIVCYSGGQAVFTNMMRKTNVFNASETTEQGKGTFSRTKDREAPHNVIVNVNLLSTNHPEIPAPTPQFNYSKDLATSTAAQTGTAIKDVSVYYPSALAQWTPNADNTFFLRTQDKKPHLDAADKSQLKTVNIVVMEVAVDRSFKDRRYGNVPKDVVIGTGKAYIFTAGKFVEATWTKTSRETSISLTAADGTPITLAPGNTWIELQPKTEGKTVITKAPTPSPTPTK